MELKVYILANSRSQTSDDIDVKPDLILFEVSFLY